MITVLDIEASGFGKQSYPIELGIILASGDVFCSLIYPEPDWIQWDASAESLHGIARPFLFEHGRSPVLIADWLNSHLSGAVVYTDNWAMDYTWLSLLFEVAERTPRFRLENIFLLINEDMQSKWHEVKERVTKELDQKRHRASHDAKILQTTFIRLNPYYAAKPSHE